MNMANRKYGLLYEYRHNFDVICLEDHPLYQEYDKII